MNSERENKHKQLLKKRDLCIYRSELTATKMDANEILMMVRVEAKFRSQMRNMYTPSRSTNGYDLLPGIWHTESKSIRTNTYKHASNTHTHSETRATLFFSHFQVALQWNCWRNQSTLHIVRVCAYIYVLMMWDKFLLTKTIKITTKKHFLFPILFFSLFHSYLGNFW